MKIDYQIEEAKFLALSSVIIAMGLCTILYISMSVIAGLGAILGLVLFLYYGYRTYSLMKIRSQENPEEGIQFKVVQ